MDTKKKLNDDDRIMTLNSLVNLSKSLDALSNELNKFSWDYTGLPVTLMKEHLISILERCILQQITLLEVEDWANLIECREDIAYEESNLEKIEQTIFRLANPELEGQLNIQVLDEIVGNLKCDR